MDSLGFQLDSSVLSASDTVLGIELYVPVRQSSGLPSAAMRSHFARTLARRARSAPVQQRRAEVFPVGSPFAEIAGLSHTRTETRGLLSQLAYHHALRNVPRMGAAP